MNIIIQPSGRLLRRRCRHWSCTWTCRRVFVRLETNLLVHKESLTSVTTDQEHESISSLLNLNWPNISEFQLIRKHFQNQIDIKIRNQFTICKTGVRPTVACLSSRKSNGCLPVRPTMTWRLLITHALPPTPALFLSSIWHSWMTFDQFYNPSWARGTKLRTKFESNCWNQKISFFFFIERLPSSTPSPRLCLILINKRKI